MERKRYSITVIVIAIVVIALIVYSLYIDEGGIIGQAMKLQQPVTDGGFPRGGRYCHCPSGYSIEFGDSCRIVTNPVGSPECLGTCYKVVWINGTPHTDYASCEGLPI